MTAVIPNVDDSLWGDYPRATGHIVQFADKIGLEYLSQVQAHVTDLICSVVDTITHMGYQFPGSAGPGKPIWQGDRR